MLANFFPITTLIFGQLFILVCDVRYVVLTLDSMG